MILRESVLQPILSWHTITWRGWRVVGLQGMEQLGSWQGCKHLHEGIQGPFWVVYIAREGGGEYSF